MIVLISCKGEGISPIVSEDSIQLIPEKGLMYHKGKPFTGIAVSYYDSTHIARSVHYLNGKKHGQYEKWFNNGRKSFESQYVTGKQHGMTYTWWRNGNLRTESRFEQGVPHGVQKQWYIGGQLFKQMNLVNGKEVGLQQSWRENGKLYNNYEAKNGRVYGLKRSKLCFELEGEVIQVGG